ncbi:TPA: 4-amino-4-deoxy-L-arabinose-phosphoundecaprenol flippase subunit ArnF [Morganella morganii]|nr:4-amino-4-deoxy-L-arabinose-phosphoundecaprenol flippase subunit ArnF [Morganella morganii]HAT1527509.1 4-amino-4-deoxy-L-arabinose-phosphoundecaprenol flippase subunit ArnF [Morganella morganii]
MRGYLWVLGSVLFVTAAQLLLKLGVTQLPDIALSPQWLDIRWLLSQWQPFAVVFAGLAGYVMSMVCWLLALRDLPLNKAYPLISLSYVFVYLLAAFLPWFNEGVSLIKSIGIIFILFGVRLIHSKEKPAV